MKRLLATTLVGIGIGIAGTKGTDAIMESASPADSSYSLDQHKYIPVVPDSLCSRVDIAHADNIVHDHELADYRVAPVQGDVNWDGRLNVADIVSEVQYLWFGKPLPVKPAN